MNMGDGGKLCMRGRLFLSTGQQQAQVVVLGARDGRR